MTAAYVTTLCWAVQLLLLKFSILCLYIRIFPNRWLKRAIMIFTVFTIMFTGPLVFLAALQCVPVRAIWDLEAQKTAKCIDWIAVLRATVVFEVSIRNLALTPTEVFQVIAEVLIFVLPIPVVIKLKLRRSKKIQLLTFFGLGTWCAHCALVHFSCANMNRQYHRYFRRPSPYASRSSVFYRPAIYHCRSHHPRLRCQCCWPRVCRGSHYSRSRTPVVRFHRRLIIALATITFRKGLGKLDCLEWKAIELVLPSRG